MLEGGRDLMKSIYSYYINVFCLLPSFFLMPESYLDPALAIEEDLLNGESCHTSSIQREAVDSQKKYKMGSLNFGDGC